MKIKLIIIMPKIQHSGHSIDNEADSIIVLSTQKWRPRTFFNQHWFAVHDFAFLSFKIQRVNKLLALFTYADGSRVGGVFSGVCVSVCLSVFSAGVSGGGRGPWLPTRKIGPLDGLRPRFVLMYRLQCAPQKLSLAPYLLDFVSDIAIFVLKRDVTTPIN